MRFKVELFTDLFAPNIIRLIGASVLYVTGLIVKLFSPNTKTYSFKAIRDMEYDKTDPSIMVVEETGQRIIGLLFIACLAVVIIYLI
ncbi:MAG: hypothetical protein ABIN95_10395 [Mucilaginibacter sp.]